MNRVPLIRRALGLLLLTFALTFAGCALGEGYSPISSGSCGSGGSSFPTGGFTGG